MPWYAWVGIGWVALVGVVCLGVAVATGTPTPAPEVGGQKLERTSINGVMGSICPRCRRFYTPLYPQTHCTCPDCPDCTHGFGWVAPGEGVNVAVFGGGMEPHVVHVKGEAPWAIEDA